MMKMSLSAGMVAKRILTCFATALRARRVAAGQGPTPPATGLELNEAETSQLKYSDRAELRG
jgi:hypothetical protein